MVNPIIINGSHVGFGLGTIPGPDGTLVVIWSDSHADVLAAMLHAIGPIPQPPAMGLGGEVVVVYPAHPESPMYSGTPQLLYNPAGDVQNQTAAAEYAALVSAWNARAAVVQAAVLALFAGGKTAAMKVP